MYVMLTALSREDCENRGVFGCTWESALHVNRYLGVAWLGFLQRDWVTAPRIGRLEPIETTSDVRSRLEELRQCLAVAIQDVRADIETHPFERRTLYRVSALGWTYGHFETRLQAERVVRLTSPGIVEPRELEDPREWFLEEGNRMATFLQTCLEPRTTDISICFESWTIQRDFTVPKRDNPIANATDDEEVPF